MEKTILVDNEYGTIELEDGILIANWKISFIDIDTAQKAVKLRLKALGGANYPYLSKISSIKGTTKEARDFLASKKASEGVIVVAILVNSILENMIASLFLYLNKPIVPTKIFKDEAKAKEWLKKTQIKAKRTSYKKVSITRNGHRNTVKFKQLTE